MARCRSTAPAAEAALNRGITSSVAPLNSGTFIAPASPPLWNMGMTETHVSPPGSKAYHSANWMVLATMLRWVSMAPLGVPVVPPV